MPQSLLARVSRQIRYLLLIRLRETGGYVERKPRTERKTDSAPPSCATSPIRLNNSRGLRHEACELTLERLSHTRAPTLGDGL